MRIPLTTRFKIVGLEVIGLGAFLLIEIGLSVRQAVNNGLSQSFSWDYAIIGVLLITVGLELLSLVKHLPAKGNARKEGELGLTRSMLQRSTNDLHEARD